MANQAPMESIPSTAFRTAYEAGNVVFFAGAGASYQSSVPMPDALLDRSARLFLPDDVPLRPLVEKVTKEPFTGSPFKGIQPEIFYEHVLSLCPDPRVLSLWRVLSPVWLATQGVQFEPNPNHFALARYGAMTGLPVFTTNFDTLFEDAARALDQSEPEVVLPRSENEAAIVARLMQEGPVPGRLTLFKLHGTIYSDGRETLRSLRTTMQSITASNRLVLGLIEKLAERRHLTFVGYSGCDIDYFPALAGMQAQTPFWFNPQGNSDPITCVHIARIRAAEIRELPSGVFTHLHPGDPEPAKIDSETLLDRLSAEMAVEFSPASKTLLLAMCLNSVGQNSDAEALLLGSINRLRNELSPRQSALASIHLARIHDCTSRYVRSARLAKSARAEVRSARRRGDLEPPEAIALDIRCLYQTEMGWQQQVGPNIAFGDARVDWRPSLPAMLSRLLSGVWVTARLLWLRACLKRRSSYKSAGCRTEVSPSIVRAEHAVNDHLLTFINRTLSLVEAMRLTAVPAFRVVPPALLRHLRRLAWDSGDYFVYAQAGRSLDKLSGMQSPDEAGEIYRLLRDPLNEALVHRDTATALLRAGRTDDAAEEFRATLEAARRSGSNATALKALIGLYACDATTEHDDRALQMVSANIEGAGYRQYVAWIAPRIGVVL